MKILAISDSHGKTQEIPNVIKTVAPGLILHLGDYADDTFHILRKFPDIPLKYVRGNCDRGVNVPETDEFIIENKRIYICHGHQYGVKMSLDKIVNTACILGVEILFFGHTHIPYYARQHGIDIINPGSISNPRGSEKTYAVITIENGVVECEICRV